MQERAEYFKQKIALYSMFILGTGIINNGFKGNFGEVLAGFIFSLVLLLILFPLVSNFSLKISFFNTQNKLKEFFFIMFLLFISFVSLYIIAENFKITIDFAEKLLLPETSKLITSLIFLILIIYFGRRTKETVLKFSYLIFLFAAFVIIIFMLLMSKNYKSQNLEILTFPKLSNSIDSFFNYFKLVTLPSLLLPFYESFFFGKGSRKALILGNAVGIFLLSICFLSSVLLFGATLCGKFSYAYAEAVSTVSIGRLFSRLDGYSYVIYFASSLIKINICFSIIKASLGKILRII